MNRATAPAEGGQCVTLVSHIPSHAGRWTLRLPAGARAADALAACCPPRWQEHVFVVCDGRVVPHDEALPPDATLEIYPIVDGG